MNKKDVNIDEDSATYKLIDVNEIKTQSSSAFVAAIEHNKIIKNKWYQNYAMGERF